MIDLTAACEEMANLMKGVADEELGAATPCASYTVADLVEHVDMVSRGFTALARHDTEQATPTEPVAADEGWRDDVAAHVRALGVAWRDPAAWRGSTDAGGLELTNDVWGRVALTEMVVHGWDLAKAINQNIDLPESTLRSCLDHVSAFVPNAPVPSLWGTPVTTPADAALIDQIVAITGRNPNWQHHDHNPPA